MCIHPSDAFLGSYIWCQAQSPIWWSFFTSSKRADTCFPWHIRRLPYCCKYQLVPFYHFIVAYGCSLCSLFLRWLLHLEALYQHCILRWFSPSPTFHLISSIYQWHPQVSWLHCLDPCQLPVSFWLMRRIIDWWDILWRHLIILSNISIQVSRLIELQDMDDSNLRCLRQSKFGVCHCA